MTETRELTEAIEPLMEKGDSIQLSASDKSAWANAVSKFFDSQKESDLKAPIAKGLIQFEILSIDLGGSSERVLMLKDGRTVYESAAGVRLLAKGKSGPKMIAGMKNAANKLSKGNKAGDKTTPLQRKFRGAR